MEKDPTRWVDYEQQGNVGAQIMLNPPLFAALTKEVIATTLKSGNALTIVDIGGGTGSFDREYLHALPSESEAINKCGESIEAARQSIGKIINLDNQNHYLEEGKSITTDKRIEFIEASAHALPLMDKSIDVTVSRQVLMHLSPVELEQHFQEISRVLRDGCAYIFTVLNPETEGLKHWVHHEFSTHLEYGQQYEYPHGSVSLNIDENDYDPVFKEAMRQFLGISPQDKKTTHFLNQYFHGIHNYFKVIEQANLKFEDMDYLYAAIPGYEKTHARYYKPAWPNSVLFKVRK